MPDPVKPAPDATPAVAVQPAAAGVSVIPADFAMQFAAAVQGEAERARLKDMDAMSRQRADEDAERAKAPKTKLVAITSWTHHDEKHPNGRLIKMGEEVEVSNYDLIKYAGKALPRAPDPLTGGVTISSSVQPS